MKNSPPPPRKQISRVLFAFLALFCFVLACRKTEGPEFIGNSRGEMSAQGNNGKGHPLLPKAMEWYEENRVLPRSEHKDDIDMANYEPDWERFAISKNSAGTDVISIPLIPKEGKKRAYLTELGLMLDKDGQTMGIIKEYMDNPFTDKTRENLYSGGGILMATGMYDPKTQSLTPDNKGGIPVSKRTRNGLRNPITSRSGTGGDLEEGGLLGEAGLEEELLFVIMKVDPRDKDPGPGFPGNPDPILLNEVVIRPRKFSGGGGR